MSVITQQERAQRLAIEHADWARDNGQTPRQVILAVRPQAMSRRMAALLTWDDAVEAVAKAWMRLR